jgi:hypothetical protein
MSLEQYIGYSNISLVLPHTYHVWSISVSDSNGRKLIPLFPILLCIPYLKQKKMESAILKNYSIQITFLNLKVGCLHPVACTRSVIILHDENTLKHFIHYSNILNTEYFGVFTMQLINSILINQG